MSSEFKASSRDLQSLADFLTNASEVSRETGVWFCAFSPTDIAIPGGSTLRVAVTGDGDDREYIIDDRIGD